MAYRVRGFDLSPFVSGMTAANDIRARGNESLSRGILSGLLSIGEGIDTRRTEKESKRRFGIQQKNEEREQGRADAALGQRMLEHQDAQLAKMQEAQANRSMLFDTLGMASEAAPMEAAEAGEVSPETSNVIKQATDALGGPEAVVQRFTLRASGST